MFELFSKVKRFFLETLWQQPSTDASVLWRGLINSMRITSIVVRDLANGELNLRAMSLVYTTLLSLVPLLAVTFSVLKAFGIHNKMEPLLLSTLEPLGPQGVEITANILGFVQNIKVGVLGAVGIAMLFYTVLILIQKVEDAFNFVWRVQRGRSLSRRFADYLSVVMIGPVLVFTALGVAASAMNAEVVQSLRAIEPFGTLLIYLSKLIPYVMIVLTFTFLYKFIPNIKVKFVPALIGATVGGVLWVTLGSVFASFVAGASNYTAIYSGFAIVLFFMIWLYLAWLILLVGTQVVFYLQNPKLVWLGGQNRNLSPRLREQEGLKLMMIIARHFQQQGQALSVGELDQKTGLIINNTQALLDILKRGELLAESTGDEVRYLPARDTANILVEDILQCLRTDEERGEIAQVLSNEPSLDQLLQRLTQMNQNVLKELNLRDLSMGKINAD
ncbi:MAG: ribonuclease BN [Gammaproteobacteria bacterium]|nr:MAG: ribonuclease BN [Gammaproteobacteria bacterium]